MSVLINTKDESILQFLEREGEVIPPEKLGEMTWDEIEKTKMPVCMVKTPTNLFAYVCYNKDQFYLHRRADGSDSNQRDFYVIAIEKLWDKSNLAVFKHLIAKDRFYEGIRARFSIDAIKNELMTEIAQSLNRTNTAKDIARKFACPLPTVINIANNLKKNGVPIPDAIKGIQYSVFVQNLKKTNPALFGIKVDVPVRKQVGRPKKKI